MSKKTINIFLVLDETGSMSIVKDDTIGGYNEYLDSLQKEKAVKYLFSMMKFDSNHRTIVHDALAVADVPKLTNETYRPGAATPLYDAIGKGINQLGKKKNVLFIIQTDGQENASHEFSREDIYSLITEKTEKGWQFVFLGANQDAWIAGGAIGIAKGNTLSSAQGQERAVSQNLAGATASYAMAASASPGNSVLQTDTYFEKTDIRPESKK